MWGLSEEMKGGEKSNDVKRLTVSLSGHINNMLQGEEGPNEKSKTVPIYSYNADSATNCLGDWLGTNLIRCSRNKDIATWMH